MRTRLPRWLCGMVAGCVVLAAAPDAASAQITVKVKELPEVTKLTIQGVKSVDVVDLEKSLSTRASSCRSLLVTPICLISHSSIWVDRQYLHRDELARDVIRIRVYYWLRGYRSADVDTVVTQLDADDVGITFNVTENEPTLVRPVSVAFDSTLIMQKRIEKLQLLKAGNPLDFIKLDSTRVLYANEMWAQGHSDATVDTTITIDTTRRLADVLLAVVPNHTTYVGDITILGLDKVSPATVLKSLTLRTGDLYRQGDVLESQRNLFESSLFRLAAIEVPPQFDSVKKVRITVSESPLHDANVAVGLTNIEFLQTEARYSAFNFFGGARKLELTATAANLLAKQLAGNGLFYDPADIIAGADAAKYLQPTWSASIDFRQPAFLHPATQVGFGAFAHRRSTPGIFIDRGYGGTMTFTDQVRIRAPVSLTYRFELNRVDAGDVYFCVNYGVCDTLAIQGLRSHQRLSPLLLTGLIDRSDDPLDPTRGYQARLDLEEAAAATLSDYSYSRAFLEVAAYNHSGVTSTYGAHLRLGWVRGGGGDGTIHPRKLFYAGGASSVRGYGTNQLGPRILTIGPERLTDSTKAGHCTTSSLADGSCDPNTVTGLKDSEFNAQPLGGTSLVEGSVEYRYPIGFQRRLSVAFFVDGAIVGAGSLPTLSNLLDLTRGKGVAPGVGVRYKSAVGPIRIDVGLNPGRSESLPVATETLVNGQGKIVLLTTTRNYTPMHTLLDRLTLHLSIGQAY